MKPGAKPWEGWGNPEEILKQQTVEKPEELLAKAPETQDQMENQASDLMLTLSDKEKEEFEKLAKKWIHDFVYTTWGELEEVQTEEKVISALVDFVMSLYNHIATKTNHLPKNKRKMITALKNIVIHLDDGLLDWWLITILKEKDESKLPELAQDFFLEKVDFENEIEENEWKMRTLDSLVRVIRNMPYA